MSPAGLRRSTNVGLSEARAREAAAQAQLKERTDTFNKATVEFERRHETLKLLLDFAGGSNVVADTRPVERDGAKLLVQASIEEAEPRVSREWMSRPTKFKPLASRPGSTS